MLAPTPASANAFQTANDAIPVDCSDQIGKLSAYAGNCSWRPFTTSWSSKNKIVPYAAAKLSILPFVAALASSFGKNFSNSPKVISQSFWWFSPSKTTACAVCELKAIVEYLTALSIIFNASCSEIGKFLPSA